MSNPMTVLLPVENDNIILTNNNLGFQPLQPQYGLSEISAQITSGVPDGQNAAIVNAGETAIPDVCAHVQYLRTQLKAGNYLDMTDESVKAWVGVMAIIALSEYRKFNLKVTTVDMNGGDAMLSVYREALKNEGLLDKQAHLHVLCLSGNPIAVMDVPGASNGKRCFCYPFSTIDNPSGVMNAIPWFLSGGTDSVSGKRIAHRWADVLGINPETTHLYLNDTEQVLFAEWLDALRKDSNTMNNASSSVDYSEAVTSVLKRLQTDVVNPDDGSLISVEATFNSPNAHKENLNAWRGVLACVGLSKLRGSRITFESYRADSNEDPYRNVLLRHNQTDEFILVLVNGARVGRLDDHLLIRPLYCVADELKTVDVPWYQGGHWVDIVNDVAQNAMDKSERRRLAEWYLKVSDDYKSELAGDVIQQLQASAQRLKNVFGAGAPGGKTAQLDNAALLTNGNPIDKPFSDWLRMFSTVPDLANPLPSVGEMFTDRLVLTMADAVNNPSKLGLMRETINKTINNRIILKGGDAYNPAAETFLALLPLRSSFTGMFSKDPSGIDLEAFQLTAVGDTIIATITLNNGGVNVTHSKQYSYQRGEILYYEEFPYLAMWPYINADSWKEYYVAWCQDIRSTNSSSVLPSSVEWEEAPLVPVAPHEDVSTYDKAPNHRWKMLTCDRFPEYVHFKYVDGGDVEVGAIYTVPPHMRQVEHSGTTYYAAIDFGSSNTIVRLTDANGNEVKDGGNQTYRVFTNKYVQPLTMNASAQLGSYFNDIKDFHEFYWLPFRGKDSQGPAFWERTDEAWDVLPTVVEVYSDASSANNKAPRYGQLLQSNCNVMRYFLGEKGLSSRPGNTLEALGIRSHIKMKRRGAATPVYDGQIAIQMILLDCALAAIENDARLSFVLSYPDDRMWGSLKQFWIPAIQNAQSICSSINFNSVGNLYRTTELYAAHHYAKTYTGAVHPSAGYCILDIGGGTSDISLWKGNGALGTGTDDAYMGGLSLKYAGDQLTAESIFSFYRKLSGAADGNLGNFRKLWNLKDAPLAIQQYEAGMEQGFDDLLALNLNVAANLDKVHEEVPLLSTMIVSDLDWSNDVMLEMAEVQPFLALLRTKVASVFYVAAQYLRFMGAYDRSMPKTPYVICMAGNGSAACEACGTGINTMAVNMFHTILADVVDRAFAVSNPQGYRKTEVVYGMCSMAKEQLATVGALSAVAFREPDFVRADGSFQDIERTNLPAEMWNAYMYYVENILQYADQLSGQDGFLEVEGDTNIYQMLTLNDPENQQHFYDNYETILNQVLNESGSGTPNWMVAQIAAIKLVDRILLLDAYK